MAFELLEESKGSVHYPNGSVVLDLRTVRSNGLDPDARLHFRDTLPPDIQDRAPGSIIHPPVPLSGLDQMKFRSDSPKWAGKQGDAP
jgi:hypothetical protein